MRYNGWRCAISRNACCINFCGSSYDVCVFLGTATGQWGSASTATRINLSAVSAIGPQKCLYDLPCCTPPLRLFQLWSHLVSERSCSEASFPAGRNFVNGFKLGGQRKMSLEQCKSLLSGIMLFLSQEAMIYFFHLG